MNVSKATFDTEVLQSNTLTIVDFWASWCGPCKMLAPIISQIEEEFMDKIKVCSVNIDEEGELALQYNIMSIPSIFFFKNGQLVHQIIGLHSKSELIQEINKLL